MLFEGGGSSRNIVHARGVGSKSEFRVTPLDGMKRAFEINIQVHIYVFEVPIWVPVCEAKVVICVLETLFFQQHCSFTMCLLTFRDQDSSFTTCLLTS